MTITKKKPIIVVLGSGAIGCYYGARLIQTGHYHVFFYMRSTNHTHSNTWISSSSNTTSSFSSSSYSYCKVHGLQISSIDGDYFIPPTELNVYDSIQVMLEAIQQVVHQEEEEEENLSSSSSSSTSRMIIPIDWILLGFKSTILDQKDTFISLLKPLLSPTTRIVAIMNGFVDTGLISILEEQEEEEEEKTLLLQLQRRLDHPYLLSTTQCMAIYAGMAFICCTRITPGHVQHTYGGKLTTSLSGLRLVNHHHYHHSSSSSSSFILEKEIQIHKEEIQSFFHYTTKTSLFEMEYIDNLIYARWKKNIWNLSFNAISVVMGGLTTQDIIQDVGLKELVLHVMKETCSIANFDLLSIGYIHHNNNNTDSNLTLGEKEIQFMMASVETMGPYKTSTTLDWIYKRPMEVKYLFRIPLDIAKKYNVSVPHLETIVLQLEALQRMYNL